VTWRLGEDSATFCEGNDKDLGVSSR
jgi:hypothetical protein